MAIIYTDWLTLSLTNDMFSVGGGAWVRVSTRIRCVEFASSPCVMVGFPLGTLVLGNELMFSIAK